MITARASGSKVYLYFMKKGRQARHRIPRNSCYDMTLSIEYQRRHMINGIIIGVGMNSYSYSVCM